MFEAATQNATSFLASLSVDVIVIAALIAIFFVVGLQRGKTALIGVIFSSYVAALLLQAFPFRESINWEPELLFGRFSLPDLILLVIGTIAIQIVLDYVMELEFSGATLQKTLDSVLLSVSASAAFLGASYMSGAAVAQDVSTSILDAAYTNNLYLFALLVLPLLGAFFVVR